MFCCKACGELLDDDAAFCESCGTKVEETQREQTSRAAMSSFCESCGAPLADDATLCELCGQPVSSNQSAVADDASGFQGASWGAQGDSSDLYADTLDKKKLGMGVKIGIGVACVVVVLAVVLAVVLGGRSDEGPDNASAGASSSSSANVVEPASAGSSRSSSAASSVEASGSSESSAGASTAVASSTSAAASFSSASASSSQEAASSSAESSQPTIEIAANQAANYPPLFTRAKASSQLPGDDKDSDYGPLMALDGNLATAWNEGAPNDGVGEWIQLESDQRQHVSGIEIASGFQKNEDIYGQNRRPANITISFENGVSYKMTLADRFGVNQTVKLAEPVDTRIVRITIDSTYPGRYFDDCCISEIRVI